MYKTPAGKILPMFFIKDGREDSRGIHGEEYCFLRHSAAIFVFSGILFGDIF